MNIIRLIYVAVLAVGFLTNGTAAAFSEGQMAGSQSITICSPDGSHEIMLGASGEPVHGEHECVDCCLFAIDTLILSKSAITAPSDLLKSASITSSKVWSAEAFSNAKARAPPLVV